LRNLDNVSRKINIIRAAELYYEKQISQADIAKQLNCSRSTVSRLLAEAMESGIVHITIRRPVEKINSLANQIKKLFKLKEVVVVAGGISNKKALENVGFASAELLSQVVHSNIIIGISFGVTLRHMVDRMDEFLFDYDNIEIIQLIGGLGTGDPRIDGPELARKMAIHFRGTYRYIQAPALLESPNLAKQLMQESYIAETINRGKNAEIVISSVGSLTDNLSSMERSGYMKKENRAEYLAKGAVGHSLARLIDENGEPIDIPYNDSVVSVPLDVLRKAKWSIGIGANPLKAPVFIAAIKGHQFNALVIDDGTAREILRLSSIQS
jgi:deoxyribonucleoside regulator